nr:uncharacterized protein LOC109731236 isoform X5 [Microcebus murinus]
MAWRHLSGNPESGLCSWSVGFKAGFQHAGCLSRRTLGTNTCDEVGRGACCAVTEASQQSQMTPQDSGLCMTVSTTVGLCTHASGSCSRTDSEVFRTGERLFSKWLFKDQSRGQMLDAHSPLWQFPLLMTCLKGGATT